MKKNVKVKYQILFFMSLLVILATAIYSFLLFSTQKRTLLDGIDNKLYTAAYCAQKIIPENYHENIVDAYSVSEDDFNQIVDTNNQLCLKLDLQYIWSVMAIGDQIVFTSSTSPNKDIKGDDHAKFFDVHQDPHAFDEVFSTKKTVFTSFKNEWGSGRMVLIPGYDSKGRPYCFGASMNVSDVESMINKTTIQSLIFSLVVFLVGLFFSSILANSFSKPITELTDLSERIARGDLTRTVRVGGSLELKSLSKSINSMTIAIRSKIEEAEIKNKALEQEVKERKKAENLLQKAHGELDQKVQARTVELKIANDQLQREIAERARTEAATKESENRFKELANFLPQTVWEMDANGYFTFVNDEGFRVYGYTLEELQQGVNAMDMFVPEDRDRARANALKMLNGEKVGPAEYNLCKKDRTVIPVLAYMNPIVREGKITGLRGVHIDISDRKLTEKELRKSRDQFQSLVTNIPGVTYRCRLDKNWTMMFMSAKAEVLTGYPATDFIDNSLRSYSSVIHPDDSETVEQAVREAIKSKKTWAIEYRIEHKDGSVRWVYEKGGGVAGDDGLIECLDGFILDITERKRTEQDLHETHSLLKGVIAQSPIPMAVVSPDGELKIFNEAVREQLGVDADSGIKLGININEIHPLWKDYGVDGKRIPVEKLPLTRALREETVKNLEMRVVRSDGSERWQIVNGTPIYDNTGKFIAGFVSFPDITDLKYALAATEEARERIEGILKSVADGLIVTDARNRIVLMNPAAENLLGVSYSKVKGQPIEVVIDDPILREKVKNTLDKKKGGYQFDFELAGIDPKRPRVMRARTSVVQGRKGPESGIITVIEDVTYKREVDRMKTEFVSTAAHELRTPLTSIRGFSEILLTRTDIAPGEQKKFLAYINEQSEELTAIINDILDITRIESGQGFALNVQPCDFGDIIRGTVTPFQANHPTHRYEVTLPENGVWLQADPDKLGQVMKNLLSNATKYSPDGGPVRVTGRVLEDHYHVTVEDEGIGMTPEQVEKVFDKFYRADATDTAVEGSGLGMTIVKHIVEAHGGQVRVTSELGKGTTANARIPLHTGLETVL